MVADSDSSLRYAPFRMTQSLRGSECPHAFENIHPERDLCKGFHASELALEGSALWPEFITSLDFEKIGAIWLVARDELFRHRIHAESRYNSKSPREQMMIHKFLERTIAFNALTVDTANRHGFTCLDVQHSNVSELAERCLSTLSGIDLP